MRKIAVSAALLAALTTSAVGADDAGFTEEVFRCWNPPSGFEENKRFVLAVEIDASGLLIDITAKEYAKGPVSRAIGESLRRALLRCAPYRFPAGVYTLTIDRQTTKGMKAKSLDPFK
ncbi:hypothetical protein [Phyllobacterium leguminum]|uniref:hypothetical protein n=1 Tax=Phyllobacterium leguminum TaxID=314237 RepID=UPI0011B3F89D|nr:hypothetical protein [Phyllobacterium leguminum]